MILPFPTRTSKPTFRISESNNTPLQISHFSTYFCSTFVECITFLLISLLLSLSKPSSFTYGVNILEFRNVFHTKVSIIFINLDFTLTYQGVSPSSPNDMREVQKRLQNQSRIALAAHAACAIMC